MTTAEETDYLQSRNKLLVISCHIISELENGSITLQQLTRFPSKSILLSDNKLWLSSECHVTIYGISSDCEMKSLYHCTNIDVSGVWSMRCYGNTVWALNNIGLLNLTQHECHVVKNDTTTCFTITPDTIWLGSTTGDIMVISLTTLEQIAKFRAHSGPVVELLYCPDSDLPTVISYGKIDKGDMGLDDVILPLAVDISERARLTGSGLYRKPAMRSLNDCDVNWETVEEIGDVLLAWQAVPCQSWKTS